MVGPWLCHPGHYHSFQSSEAPPKERPSYLASLGLSRAAPKSPSAHCFICHTVLDAHVCTCLACGLAVHRACLSKTQRTSSMKREDRVIPICTSYLARTMAPSTPEVHPTPASPQLQLLEELSLDPLHVVSPRTPQTTAANSNVALQYIRRYAPYVAGGVLVGGAAVMGMPMMALTGLGVGLSTAQGSLVWSSRASSERTKAAMDVNWARRICWELKQKADIGDSSYKQDAALLRRYHNATDAPPTTNDVYVMLFGLCASTDELLGRVNSALCEAFRSRRKLHPGLKQTLEDAQVYVGHVLAVTMNTYPALSTTDESIMDATEAVEKIVYSDIYSTVFTAFRNEYAAHDATLRACVREVRNLRPDMSTETYLSTGSAIERTETAVALQALCSVQELTYPLGKLHALSRSFRALCNVAEARFASAPNADMLLPMVMDLIVYAPTSAFVAHLAFVSTLTHGGGRGVDGYALTTFHVALRALASIDVAPTSDEDEDDATTDNDDEFFDAVEG
ncbi:hypothetical protein SPRG_08698 [Saprolegnia parasitica CBS 223.65]|uniref:VPS9 domain-containing protein n=1 Tax=Saprolegnia parasitica (strain CBS 223.65) TaxID=695850 RepID=A0A067CA43_SAPPC|nr:hypothetical protein SPRG_08698 [Saprolegnia parasitica CBS 223.65]KDO26045.1 hypothetical protein SPRG_08698 [Saprolegnia parasitica CBS 223.65]|eukprot:XP_012203331.1 hypothetical protein SPRG_08698 [Saprolegnia parasitica CBS 223.65]